MIHPHYSCCSFHVPSKDPKMVFILLCLQIYFVCANFTSTDLWSGASFFDNFDFFTDLDPTNGFNRYVYFASRQQSFEWGLTSAHDNVPVYMGSDHSTISTGRGRASVRITSKQGWNVGPGSGEQLFVIDLLHMPTGCGTWPAWWFVGPNWPDNGEIDVIEGVNQRTFDALTLHTNGGCAMDPHQGGFGPGGFVTPNCDVNAAGQPNNAGCSISGAPNSYGEPFNQHKGGVYAALWGHDSIRIWFFPRGRIPSDLGEGSTFANPDSWGLPMARFNFGRNCSPAHFKNLQMVFDLTFCGDWAGATFPQDCPGLGDCVNFVRLNPAQFKEAYWLINFVKIYQSR